MPIAPPAKNVPAGWVQHAPIGAPPPPRIIQTPPTLAQGMADDMAASQLRYKIAKASAEQQADRQRPIVPMTASSPPASDAQLAWEQPEVPIDDGRMAAFRAQRQQTPEQFIAAQDEANRLHHSPEEWTAYLARQSDEYLAAQQRVLPATTASLQAKAPRSPFNWDKDNQ